MNAVSVGFSALAAASILLTIPPFTLLQRRIFVGESTGGRSVALVAATGAVVVALGWATHAVPIPGLLVAPVIALGALFATIATSTMPAASGGRTLVFAAIATAAVFLPIMVLVFGIVFDPFGTQLGVIDLGGGIPALVAGGATALGVSLVGGRPSRRAGPGPGIRSLLWPTLLLWVAWIGWLVGLELAADDMVPIILTSVVVMPAVAGAAGSLVERLRFRRTTASGAVCGVLAGLAAAAPACAFVTGPIAVIIALVVGVVSAVLPTRLTSSASAIFGVSASISVVLLGAVATHLSYIYTGQPELVFGQLLAVVLAAGAGLVAGGPLARLLRSRGR
jgi:ammonia channel protein AmtB